MGANYNNVFNFYWCNCEEFFNFASFPKEMGLVSL